MKRSEFLKAAAQTAAVAAVTPAALDAPRVIAEAAAPRATTTVTFWQFNTDAPSVNAWKKAIAGFEAANPGIKVNMQIVPWSEQAQKLTTAIATGTAPDISMMGNDVVAQYANTGALVQLDPYFAAWSKEIGHDITQDILPGDHLYYRYKGHWYASPVAEETRLVYYRKSMLQKAGINPAKAFASFQSMRQAAIALNKPAQKVYGWGLPMGISYFTLQTFMNFYLGWGARYLTAKGLCGFDAPEFRQALAFYANLYTKDKVTPPDSPVYDNSKLEPLWAAGKLAMMIDGPWVLNIYPNKTLSADTGLAYIPAGPKGRYGFLGGWPLVMWSQGKNQAAAFKFVRYATDPAKAMNTLCQGLGNLPGRKSLADQAPWNKMPVNIFMKQLQFSYPYQYPAAEIPQMGALEPDVVQTAVQAVATGKSTVEQATKDMVTHINQVLQGQ